MIMQRSAALLLPLVLLATTLPATLADTDANCTYAEIEGVWEFSEGQRFGSSDIDCTDLGKVERTLKVELLFPNVAVDELGNKGSWALIYNQGFEVTVNNRKYFAFSYYTGEGEDAISYCDRTFNGWSHDVTVRHWACYSAKRTTAVEPKRRPKAAKTVASKESVFHNDQDFIRRINQAQTSWRARSYPQFEGKPHDYMIQMAGGIKSAIDDPSVTTPDPTLVERVRHLPENFDWRNVDGKNYLSPVRNQASCGSCYAFACASMLEARLRILSDFQVNVTLSPQEVVSCARYSQGCAGGFNYLTAGKHGQDYGFVEEHCHPYTAEDTPCNTSPEPECRRYYISDFDYVGGYYGACNEELILEELVQNGPLAVAYMVYPDFKQYEGGIYHHTGLISNKQEWNPFEIVNHAVVIVGYGVEPTTGEKFWSVKNSWGEDWGEEGYFRIRRGTNEVSIESKVVKATPIPF